MKSNTKILIGFLLIILLILVQMSITYKLQNNFYDNTRLIKEVEAPLETMSEQVMGYNGILTAEACAIVLHAQKGDFAEIKEHRARYDEIGIKLDELLKKDAKILITQSKRSQEEKDKTLGYIKNLDELNLKLVDLETRAFDAIDKKDIDTAYSLVVGEDYHRYKQELYQEYRAWADLEHKMTNDIRSNILKDSQQIIYFNLGISIGIMIMIIMTMFVIRSFVAARETAIVKKEKELDVRDKMEKTYKTLFENATDSIFIADVETRQLVDCNKSAEKLTGYSREKILSMKADELHPKDKIKETMEGFKKQAEGKIKSVFTEVLTKDKKRISVKVNASAVKIGGKRYNQGIFTKLK